jgi:hypothetical protein
VRTLPGQTEGKFDFTVYVDAQTCQPLRTVQQSAVTATT